MTSPIVLDPSAVLAILFDDEDDSYACGAIAHAARFGSVVPRLFWYEIRGVIIKGVRRGRTTIERGEEQMHLLRSVVDKTAVDPSDHTVFDVAMRGQLTGYDAVYAALALNEPAEIATMDRGLKSAAGALGFTVWSAS